ncbi:hypothetical protein GPL15_14660 [Clostridium sp. MCC353]|uniref:hypothetical protein n=1 Tax=Clostridium sp. MCC353 TaxID=2592646 RepID=UPI001C00A208|nr:hypothetical protein [Clostridium sp. MCC353]MBT9777743.1 hypothetical protein [Clostridium sp. MCC353]
MEPRKAVRAQLGRGRQERVGRWTLGTLGVQEPAWGSRALAAADGNPGERRMVRDSSDLFRPSAALGLKGRKMEGKSLTFKVSDLGSLNRKFLQKFSMNAPGTLHFPPFQT